MNGINNRIIVVLGMHRSGTSAITRALALLGVGLGSDLHPAGFDNPRGFWEDVFVLEINEELLRLNRSAYDRLTFEWQETGWDKSFSSLKIRATHLVIQKLKECGGIWGFKDPRTCRLLPFWLEVFRAVGCQVSFVIATRHPLSVSDSLQARNQIPPEKTHILWCQHLLPVLTETEGYNRVVVDYDLLLENPYKQLERVAGVLSLPLPAKDSGEVIEFTKRFLEAGLRHSQYSLDDLGSDSRAWSLSASLYCLLFSIASDAESLSSKVTGEKLKEMNAALQLLAPLARYSNYLEDVRAEIWQTLDARDGQIVSLNQGVMEREGRIVSLNQGVMEREGRIASLNQVVMEQEGQIARLNQVVMDREGQIGLLHQEAGARDGQIVSLNQVVMDREGQIAHLHHVVGERDRQIEKILRSRSWRITRPLRFFRRSFVTQPLVSIRRRITKGVYAFWYKFPLRAESKREIKSLLFNYLPILFSTTRAYKQWQHFSSTETGRAAVMDAPRADKLSSEEPHYVPLLKGKALKNKPVKLICFYLPQFHPIPENDDWWGEGFTEWTNVQPAQPQFDGHYQPHVPGELGYYSLLDAAVQRRQVELAKHYGIGGFCFYLYWFGGKRLLETPIENYLHDDSLDLPFCLCWANENWSRRWDGLDSEILIAQQHSAEDDLAFIEHVARYMRDPRYIRIDGKPLLLVYRPSLLPSAKETSLRWRKWCNEQGIGDIYLAYTQSFETVAPAQYGFDAAIEFPPNNSAPPIVTDKVSPIADDFACTVYDWRVFLERSKHYAHPDYKLFRSVCPSWDNTARRKNRGTIFLNSTPADYQQWLENAIVDTVEQNSNPDERLVFVNAWNEWAEGAHLEPDSRHGYAWLQATRNALSGEAYIPDNKRRIVLVAHDAYPHGAQMLAANLARTLSQGMGFHVDLVCLGDGPLIGEYSKWATVHQIAGENPRGKAAKALAATLYQNGHRNAIVNTTVSGYFIEALVAEGIECVALIHELKGVLDNNGLHGHARAIAAYAKKVIFPAKEVAESFNEVALVSPDKVVIRPQGLYKRREHSADRESDRLGLRQKLGVPDDAQIVLGVGYADHRKGVDLFVAAGMEMANRLPKARWVWIGHWEGSMQRSIEKQLSENPEFKDRFIFPGLQKDTALFYGGADVLALTSREDPFPSVVLEALDSSMPVIGFEGAGGFIGLLNAGCGRLVPREDAKAFALAVADLLENPSERDKFGQQGRRLINEQFSFRRYVFDLLDLSGIGLDRISAIVPNYNYAHYLPVRLESIIKQDYPIFEIIFLDDSSQDESLAIAEKILHESGIDYQIIPNKTNSGSVFRQWWKGVEISSGTHVWLAEADDECSSTLISELIKGFRTPGVVLSYCESQQIDEVGSLLGNNYLHYVSDVDGKRWLTSYVADGEREIVEALSTKNTIPNVSAVLFKADALKPVLENRLNKICSYRIAGDWLVYVLILANGRIAFNPLPLNKHRRHNSSATISSINISQINEIRDMQNYVAEHFGVPSATLAKANDYIDLLKDEHGISESELQSLP